MSAILPERYSSLFYVTYVLFAYEHVLCYEHPPTQEIARMDAIFLRGQLRKRWKQHSLIVKRLTCKSKQQLKRLKLSYNKPVEAGGQGRDIVTDVREMLGGPYGEFIRSFFLSWLDNAIDYIECAVSGIGCDDSMLIDVVCLATETQLQELHEFLDPRRGGNNRSFVNLKKITGKTRKGSSFQMFLLRVLEGDRSVDDFVDQPKAAKQAEIVFSAITSTPPNYSALFEVLCTSSRQQCGLISDEYLLAYNVTLTKALDGAFQGNVARALKMWVVPRHEAFGIALHHALAVTASVDAEAAMHAVSNILGSLDKVDASSWVKTRYHSLFDEKLEDKIAVKVQGKLKDALLGWVDGDSFDSNLELEESELVAARGGAPQSESEAMGSASMKTMSPLVRLLWLFIPVLIPVINFIRLKH